MVEGDSMLPLLRHKQSVLAVRPRRLSSWTQSALLRRGDVVVLRHPVFNDRIFIKRVVGLPDEEAVIKGGLVSLSGELLDEPYLGNPVGESASELVNGSEEESGQNREWWTGPEEYFVLGDNRWDSHDSRAFGPVHQSLILGRVWFRCWPPKDWGWVPGDGGHRL